VRMSVKAWRGNFTKGKYIHWNDREERKKTRSQRKCRKFIIKERLGQRDEIRTDGHDNEGKQRHRC